MNPINPVSTPASVYKITPGAPTRPQDATAVAQTSRGADRVELSGLQSFMAALKSNDIRADKVADVKAQIAAGTYESDEKLNVAIDRLIDDLS